MSDDGESECVVHVHFSSDTLVLRLMHQVSPSSTTQVEYTATMIATIQILIMLC